jgi:hypothetical protein
MGARFYRIATASPLPTQSRSSGRIINKPIMWGTMVSWMWPFSLSLAIGFVGCGGETVHVCEQIDQLQCGTDGCGNPLSPFCRSGLWVCPTIPFVTGCSTDASSVDAGAPIRGAVSCPDHSGYCLPGMFCEATLDDLACAPVPMDCSAAPTCPCLLSNAMQDNLCPGESYLCNDNFPSETKSFWISCAPP